MDTYSTRTTAPVTVLRDAEDGHVIKQIARADTTRLFASGWRPPVPFTVKARDGKTDLYGMMFKPTHFDPKKKYPIIDYIYPGPQTGSVRGRSFLPPRSSHQALAELGFIVVAIDGMGTPWRSKSFHDTWYGDMGDNTLPDQVAAIRQLAQRNRWIDIDKVGIGAIPVAATPPPTPCSATRSCSRSAGPRAATTTTATTRMTGARSTRACWSGTRTVATTTTTRPTRMSPGI